MRPAHSLKQFFATSRQQQLLVLLLMLIFGTAALLLGQDNSWDLRSYHFYNGYAFLHQRIGWDLSPAGEQSFLNPFFDVFNYLLISTQNPLIASFSLGTLSGLNCYLLYKIAHLSFQDLPKQQLTYSLFAVLIGVTSANGIGLIGTTTNDTKMTLLFLLALYTVIKGVTDTSNEGQRQKLMFAGLVMGLDVGLKLVAACYGIGLLAGLLFLKKWQRQQLALCGLFLASMAAGFLLSNGYWMFFLYQHFHNPLFPYYNNIFHSAYAPYTSFSDPKYYPQHYLTLPFLLTQVNSLISDAPIRELRYAVLYSLALIVLLKQFSLQKRSLSPSIENSSSLSLRLIALVFIVSYGLWFFEFTIYRYLLPLDLLSGLVLISLLRKIFRSEKLRQISLMCCTLAFMLTTYPLNWGRVDAGKHFFDVAAPLLPPNSTVILTGVPLAYTIPFFQKDVHFIGMNFFIHGGKYSGVKNPISQNPRTQLQTEFADPLIAKAQGKNLYSLSFERHSTDVSVLPPAFQANYVLSKTSRNEPWKLFRLVTQGKYIVLEEFELKEIPGLEEMIAQLPPDKLSTQLSAVEKEAIDKVMANYQTHTPFKEDYDPVARALSYQYGLIRSEKDCLSFSTKVDKLELCPLQAE